MDCAASISSESKDIEVPELPIDETLAMMQREEIVDGKTNMLLRYGAVNLFG